MLTLALLSLGSALLIVEELRPVSVVPPVGAVAERDIRAGVSFEYVDQLHTDADRRAAEAQVLPVFDFDPKLADRVQGRVSDAFAEARGRHNEATLVARAEGRAELTEAERSAVALEFLRRLEFTLDPEDLDHLAALGWSREVEELSRQLLDVAAACCPPAPGPSRCSSSAISAMSCCSRTTASSARRPRPASRSRSTRWTSARPAPRS
jgi:membrane-associated HD superfamily phosphohydrolase